MNKRIFYALVSLSVLILLLGSSFLYFNGDFLTGNLIFNTKVINTKSSTYSPVSTTSKTSCVDSNYANKVMVTTPSTSTTKLKPSSKTQTFYDTCLDSITLKDYYCKNGKIASISKSCEGYCDKGVCKKVTENTPIDQAVKLVKYEKIQIATLNPIEEEKGNYVWDVINDYDAYYLSGSSLRVVCQQPCEIPATLLKKKVIGSYIAVNKLVNLVGIDTLLENKPTDIHLTADSECDIKYNNTAFSGVRFGDKSLPGGHSFLCTWEWDNHKNNEETINQLGEGCSCLKEGDQFSENNIYKFGNQGVLLHEYFHLILYGRTFSNSEMFAYSLALKVVEGTDSFSGGCDDTGCNTYHETKPLIETPCKGDAYGTDRSLDFYGLCDYCGFDFKKMKQMFLEIEKANKKNREVNLYIQNNHPDTTKWPPTWGCKEYVSDPQLKEIMDKVVGKDVIIDCKLPIQVDPSNEYNNGDYISCRKAAEALGL